MAKYPADVVVTFNKTRISSNFLNHKYNIFVGENLSPNPNLVRKVLN